jgi:hypothetical protein
MFARRSLPFAVALTLATAPLGAGAQMEMPMPAASARPAATPAPPPSASEAAFLRQIMTLLPQLYPTPAAATTAGYVRYTNEDRTGAISYVNPKYWNSTEANHPSQLWYDVNGRLLGADYSIPFSDAANGPTALLGISPSRFHRVPPHVHYVVCANGGTSCTYGRAIATARYAAANDNDFAHPTAAGLVRAGAPGVTNAADVKDVILFPGFYDVSVWVLPNPLGQFADPNPTVHPSGNAGPGESNG